MTLFYAHSSIRYVNSIIDIFTFYFRQNDVEKHKNLSLNQRNARNKSIF